MEKPSRPILTAPSKISSLSKSSSFTKQQTTTGSSDSTTRRVMSPLTKSILLKSSSTPDAQTCLMSRSNLELSIEKDQYQKEKNGSTTDSNSQPETPTRTLPSFQIGLSPVRKLSYTSKTNNVRNINENGLNASESKGDNLSEPSEEKFVSASLQEDNSSTSNNRDNHLESSNKILTNSVKRDNLSASLKSLRETEESVTSVTSQSRLKDTLESQNSNITNARTGYGDEKSVTCDGEHLNFDEKMANSLQSIDIPDYVSDGSDKTQKTTERLLVENKNNKTIINGPFNVSLTTPQTTTNTPDNIDSDSETADDMSLPQGTCEAPEKSSKLSQGTSETAEKSSKLSQGTSETAVKTSELQERTSKTADETLESKQGTSKTAVKTLESSQETSKTAVETLESQHGTSKTVFETSKLSQGTHASSYGTTESSERSKTSTRTPETSHNCSDNTETSHNCSDNMETSHSDNTETSHNCSDNTETSHNCSDNMETSHNCSDNGNQIVFESARKEVLEKSDVCDVVDSKTHKKSPLASNKNAHTKTTYEDIDHQKGSIRPSVERGRTHDIISSNDDTTGQQSTASFQVQPDTKNKRVRSQSPGWNFFSRSRVNSKGSNIPSKLRSLFSPKDKDKEKSPKMSPKFKPKNFKLFRKSDDVTQIWEIYDIDTPDGTNDTQTDVLGLSNQMQLSETRGTHPDISASGLQNQVRPSETRGIHPDISALGLQNQVQPSSDKIILPVTSKPTILSPSEAEQSLNVNKNPTVQTPINSVVLETDIYSHTHKNGTVTSAGSEITSDSLNLCKDTSKSPSDENFRELESNISAKRAENNSIYEDVVPSIVSPEIGKSDSLLEMINMKFDKENKQNLIPDSLLVQNNDTNVVLDNDAPKPPVRRHSAKRQAIQLTTVSSMTPSGNSSQEQENEQVSHLSSGSNTQTPTQHQTSNGSRLSTQNDVDTASGIKYEMSQNSSSTKLSVPCLNLNASLLENNVKDVGTSPPPIPSPRRRLRRRFSLGPRKLDDDEFIGFASLPEQVHRKAVKRGFEFSLMVVGESGLGKSTLINSLFLTDLYKDRKLPTVQDNVNKTVEISKKSLEIEERGVKLRLTIVDTPGYNDAVNGEECWKNIIDYVDNQFEQYYQAESGLNRKNIQDTRVHCCLYFISPYGHGLKPMDVNFMKKLHKKCNIVPLVAKSDTLTPKEVKRLKLRILKEIEDNCIEIYQFPDCDSDEDDEFKEQDKALKAAIPFAIVGSNTVVEAGGKRIRGRMYPWGIVEVDNPSHCDFTKLRQMLISTHMQDLKDITSDVHYENYRAEHLASQMNKSQKERSKLKRDSVTNIESVVETEKLLQQKEAEIQRMQAMLAKMQAQLHGGSGQQVNGTVTNTQI